MNHSHEDNEVAKTVLGFMSRANGNLSHEELLEIWPDNSEARDLLISMTLVELLKGQAKQRYVWIAVAAQFILTMAVLLNLMGVDGTISVLGPLASSPVLGFAIKRFLS